MTIFSGREKLHQGNKYTISEFESSRPKDDEIVGERWEGEAPAKPKKVAEGFPIKRSSGAYEA